MYKFGERDEFMDLGRRADFSQDRFKNTHTHAQAYRSQTAKNQSLGEKS